MLAAHAGANIRPVDFGAQDILDPFGEFDDPVGSRRERHAPMVSTQRCVLRRPAPNGDIHERDLPQPWLLGAPSELAILQA